MSRAVPHFVRIIEAPGQPAREEQCASKKEAIGFGACVAKATFHGAVVSVWRGESGESIDSNPVKVWL